MADIGFIYTGTTYATPDKTMTRQSNPKVLLATFGDGYEQRAVSGINNLKEQYSVSFNNRPKAEIDDIVSFFNAKEGVTAFSFTVPDTNSPNSEFTIKAVVDTFSVSYNNNDFYSCTATIRRVYEA